MILGLAGGVGGAKLAKGLAEVLGPKELTVVVNTGDDFEHLGLAISPDLDTVMYTLAGISDAVRGWGLEGESWNFMQQLEKLGGEAWFRLGDRDLATHVQRTQCLREGLSLSRATQLLCASLGLTHPIVPMSDDPVRTLVHTDAGVLGFQDYFVRRRAEPVVTRLEYAGANEARIADGFRAALDDPELRAVIVCPSNPYLSIAPILALPGVREALRKCRAPVIAVSPIVAGQAIKGPAAKIMRELGSEPSSIAVARFYEGLIDGLVVDRADAALAGAIERRGMQCFVTDTVMREPGDRAALAQRILEFARIPTRPART